MKIVEQEPFIHNFSVNGNDDNLPEKIGVFETIDEFQEFFALNTVSEHQKVTARRWYTDEEIQNLREIILTTVEEELPEAKQNLMEKESNLSTAKKEKEIAVESVGALQTKISDLVTEIKGEKTTIDIPSNRTYRVPYKGKYYFYVWQDNGDCVLAYVQDIPDHEKAGLFNTTKKNDQFFKDLKDGKNKGASEQIS
ncbi:hypothetical protein [Chryseobacterium arthrosphaerae]|uniref:hypothetical protein n=1 Tax=Chryseobacterium arthrosphaerae TaxID=651561 RepID=UPI003D32EDD6